MRFNTWILTSFQLRRQQVSHFASQVRYHVHETATLESPALVGMAGHLHISGKGVALGYIGEPDLTEERFYDSKLAGGRSYKTGDLVRLMPENPWGDLCGSSTSNLVLEFLGRADFQVKVRGHRIELQEIEEAARQVGMVEAVSVLVKEENLVAFVTPEMVDVKKLRQALEENLPKYMVPHIIAQAELPLTTSGKVDRKALEESLLLRAARRRIREAQNQLEQMVLNAYQTVLSREELSIDDDFFE